MGLSCFLRPALRVASCQRFYASLPRYSALQVPHCFPMQTTRLNLAAVNLTKSDFSQVILDMLREMSMESSDDDEGGMKQRKRNRTS